MKEYEHINYTHQGISSVLIRSSPRDIYWSSLPDMIYLYILQRDIYCAYKVFSKVYLLIRSTQQDLHIKYSWNIYYSRLFIKGYVQIKSTNHGLSTYQLYLPRDIYTVHIKSSARDIFWSTLPTKVHTVSNLPKKGYIFLSRLSTKGLLQIKSTHQGILYLLIKSIP